MKFYLLPIGEKCIYQGISYTKSGPLTASSDVNGHNKMIPRSANVQTSTNVKETESTKDKEKILAASNVVNAINIFYQDANENLKDIQTEMSEAAYNKAKLQLECIYKKVLSSLALS